MKGGRSVPRGLVISHPLRSGAPFAAAGAIPLVLGIDGPVRLTLALAFAAACVVAGSARGLVAHRDLTALRRDADRQIRRGRQTTLNTALVTWRTAELTSDRHRRWLARSVERTLRDLSPQLMPNAVPLNRVAVRPHADLLLQIALRLRALDRPVTPRGVLLVQDLMSSADSPLYLPEAAPKLRRSMLACLDALDGTPGDVGFDERHLLAVA